MKPGPFLGVITSPAPPALVAQLGLPEEFGLLVEEVSPDSPAAKAGLQRHDVLKSFDDQQLVSPEQLAVLVRGRGKDANVSLTIIRNGQEQKITVKIGERMMPEHTRTPRLEKAPGRDHFLFHRRADPAQPRPEDQVRRLQERLKGFQEQMRQYQDRFHRWQQNPGAGPAPEPPRLEADEPRPTQSVPPPPQPRDLLREVAPGGAPAVSIQRDGNVTTWNTAHARVIIKDPIGEVIVGSENGRRVLTARNAHGETIFSGPIDTEEQRHRLPEEVRQKLANIDVHTSVAHGGEAPLVERAHHPPDDDREIQ